MTRSLSAEATTCCFMIMLWIDNLARRLLFTQHSVNKGSMFHESWITRVWTLEPAYWYSPMMHACWSSSIILMSRLYNSQLTNLPCWQRLNLEASIRQHRSLRPTPPEPLFAQQPPGSRAAQNNRSGFVSNTCKVVYEPLTTFRYKSSFHITMSTSYLLLDGNPGYWWLRIWWL